VLAEGAKADKQISLEKPERLFLKVESHPSPYFPYLPSLQVIQPFRRFNINSA